MATYIFNRKYQQFFEINRDKRFLVLCGGAGAGKSFSIAQWLIYKLYNETDKEFLILRKTLPSLKITAYKLIKDLLDEYGCRYQLNKAEMRINANGNEIIFRGLDDPEKVKSFEPNVVWIEESTEFAEADFLQLNLRLRRHTEGTNQIYLSFNPISKLSWLYKRFFEKGDPEAAILLTTYKDNRRYLSQSYIAELERLKDVDETFHQVYTLGQWGVLKNTIYSNYKIIDKFPKTFDEIIYGLDFGYNNPSALIEIGIKDNVPYLRERLYRTGLTTPELIRQMDILKIDKKAKIYGDSEDPNAIEQIFQAGYNIHPCRKGKGSVKAGIDYCKSRRLFIWYESANLIAELQSYKWREDKNGNVLEEPVKFKDHLCDSFRMALWSHRHKPMDDFVIVDL